MCWKIGFRIKSKWDKIAPRLQLAVGVREKRARVSQVWWLDARCSPACPMLVMT